VPKLTRRLIPLLSVAVLAAGTGCGPFGYLKKVAKDATRAVADAEKAGAEQYAPYEYWGAVSYLEQAKVMMAYSEYERSFDYGTRAKQLADEAKNKAERRESGRMQERAEDMAPEGDTPAAPVTGPGAASSDASASGEAEGGSAKGKVEVGGSVGGGK
jgi:glucose-6-phosphate isomerase